MEFKLDKCKVLHFGWTNHARIYTVNGRNLANVMEQRNLGVLAHSFMMVVTQVNRLVKVTFGTLAFIG